MAPDAPPEELRPGWFAVPDAGRPVVFSQQLLPNAVVVEAPSIRRGALAAARALAAALPVDGPWRLEAVRPRDCPLAKPGRAKLAIAATLDALKQYRRSAWKRHQEALPPEAARAQLGLLGADLLAVSVADPALRQRLRSVLSPLPGGLVDIPEDRRPPSRAYRKLLEAEAQFERRIAPGETCVDLGGSPGGWTFIALERGAAVALVDRAPPRADVLGHPRLTFVQGDAFRHAPAAPVDWLLCDVIAFPQRTLQLLEDWLGAKRCRRFVVTFKFRGDEDHPTLDAAKAVLARLATDGRLRRLFANKNEAMAFGSV